MSQNKILSRLKSLISVVLFLCCATKAFAGPELFRPEVSEVDLGAKVIPPKKKAGTLEYQFTGEWKESSYFSGIRLSLLGNPAAVSDFLFLFHGDTPSYYDSTTGAGKSNIPMEHEFWKLHRELLKSGEGLVVIQPKATRQDWHSLYRTSDTDFRGMALATEIRALYVGVSQHFQGKGSCHFHSFSGAGRVDRALHIALLGEEEVFSDFRNGVLQSWTASDAMVNNAFSKEDKLRFQSVMAVSWANFINRFPAVPVTLIYDRSGEYAYMQGVNLDVIRFSRNLRQEGKITLASSVKIVEQGGSFRTVNKNGSDVLKFLKANEEFKDVLTLTSAKTHTQTFLGKIADSYLRNRALLRSR